MKTYFAHFVGYIVSAATIVSGTGVLPPQYAFVTALAGLVVTAAHHGYTAGNLNAVVAAAANAATAVAKNGVAPLFMVCAILGLSGCATTNAPTTAQAQPVMQAAVLVAVATAEQHGVQAKDINRIAKVALLTDQNDSATLGEIGAAVNYEINQLPLQPADVAAVAIVTAGLASFIKARIGSDPKIAATQTVVADVLREIIVATGG